MPPLPARCKPADREKKALKLMNVRRIAMLLLLLGPLCKGQQMPHEEEVVRTTYAKLSYADEIRIIMRTMNKLTDKWKADEHSADKEIASRLDFQLSDFKSGPVSEIEGRIISEVAGLPPEGDTQGTLRVTPATFNYQDSTGVKSGTGPIEWTLYADIVWDTAPQRRGPGDGWPLAAVLDLKEMNGPYARYATYTVTVTFQSKSRTYHTAALFGKNPDGTDNVHFLDLVSGAMTLDLLAKTDMSTAPFSKTPLRDVPFVRKWLNDNPQSCNVKGHGDVCCNTNTKRCGGGISPISARPRNPYLVLAGFHPKAVPVRGMFQASCSSFNFETFYPHGNGNGAGHVNGQHTLTSTVDGTCVYSAPAGVTGPGPCNVACTANASGVPQDFGTLTGFLPHFHVGGMGTKSGQEGGNQTAQCQGTNAVSFLDCLTSTCSVTVSVSGSSNGIGATITFANSSLWNDNQATVHNCQSRSTAPTPTPTPPPPPPPPPPCSPPPSDELIAVTNEDPDCEPLILDITGDGFRLTDTINGVVFDIRADGRPLRIPWTAGATNAFLVLDRNGNGVIDNGSELFGNVTPQPHTALRPNGFLAVAEYDKSMAGGNGDGVIDENDVIFPYLRLWIDDNHDGISQPSELHTLPELGVYSISLNYSLSKRTDEFGNVFRYRAKANQDRHGESDVGKKIYDVFFVNK